MALLSRCNHLAFSRMVSIHCCTVLSVPNKTKKINQTQTVVTLITWCGIFLEERLHLARLLLGGEILGQVLDQSAEQKAAELLFDRRPVALKKVPGQVATFGVQRHRNDHEHFVLATDFILNFYNDKKSAK